ncbi:hypothetical protein [Phaffia rhodozyma]|uniref:Nucleoporin Pom152 n=1 Tax=Phaffia rhodozyma TaxID=264483 RepID=A0A0F7SLL8_PHARH|nr:hypothetical protein [Phaffia rhodozyma]
MSVQPPGSSSPLSPVIPTRYFHQTEQRLYALSAFTLLQAYKLYVIAQLPSSTSTSSSSSHGTIAPLLLAQTIFVYAVPLLRIPRLMYDKRTRWAIIALLLLFDWLLLGGWRSIPFSSLVPSSLTAALTYYPTISSTRARVRDVVQPGKHLLGQYTLHVTPYSTARLPQIPLSHPLPCLSARNPIINIPITFNTTRPEIIEYTLTLPSTGETLIFNATASMLEELKPTKRHRRHLTGIDALDSSIEDMGDEEDEDEIDTLDVNDERISAEKTVAVADKKANVQRPETAVSTNSKASANAKLLTLLLPIDQPATLRLSRVWSQTGTPFRLSRSDSEKIQIWACPKVTFLPPLTPSSVSLSAHSSSSASLPPSTLRCAGEKGFLDIKISTAGHTGLRLGWISIDSVGNKEDGWLEGIGEEDEVAALLLEQNPSSSSSTASVPGSYIVPFPVSFPNTGSKTYTLTALSSPHIKPIAIHPIEGATKLTFDILPSPSISFSSACSPSRPLKLLDSRFAPSRYSPPVLQLIAQQGPADGNPFVAKLKYIPLRSTLGSSASESTSGSTAGWKKEIKMNSKETLVQIETGSEGTYFLESVTGGRCLGEVREPSECRAEIIPVPEVGLDVKRLKDECAGEQGFEASFSFRGSPPFKLSYTREFRSPSSSHSRQKSFTEVFHSVHEIRPFQPEEEGTYIYEWISLADSIYTDGISLTGERKLGSVEMVVHPLAQARLRGRGEKKVVYECQGGDVDIDIELKGKAPFTLTVLTASPKSVITRTLTNLTGPLERVKLQIPKDWLADVGPFSVSLGEVTDGNGCTRRLSEKGVEIELRRGRPSAKIYSQTGDRRKVVPAGADVKIPLRLFGEGPWTVKYANSNHPKPLSIDLKSINAEIKVNEAGTYRLLEVRSQHCEGVIHPGEDVFTVEHIPRPTLSLTSELGRFETRKGIYIRQGVCVGDDDQIALKMQGQAPFHIDYTTAFQPEGKDTRSTSHLRTLGAIQPSTILHLETGSPGTYIYKFHKIGDANYVPLPKGISHPPGSNELTVEQVIYGRPNAVFESNSPISLCSNAVLSPQANPLNRGRVILYGKAPFELDLSIQSAKVAQPIIRRIKNIPSREWTLDIPDVVFDRVGAHIITIDAVRDSSGCEQDMIDPELAKLKVEVAETASVVPIGRSEDVCVGQTLDFLLQGSSPWKLTYDWNGTPKTVTHKHQKFSLLGDQPGRFAIVSIAHEKNPCKVEVNDISREIHGLPSARISAGDTFIEEGEQAEIVFSFEGEAPFSFTYTRSEPASLGRAGQVLEEHTVTNILENTYSMYASSEGTWKVTMIEDKWCRYPPLQSTSPPLNDKPLKLEGIDPFPPIAPL